jgi:hypothetical protein
VWLEIIWPWDVLLFAVPAAHPCAAVQAALRIKRVCHRRVDLPPLLHKPFMLAAFGAGTALALGDGERIVPCPGPFPPPPPPPLA